MHNLASVLKNDTHKLLWDFKMEVDYLISCKMVDFANYSVKLKENEKKDKYLDLAREQKNNRET